MFRSLITAVLLFATLVPGTGRREKNYFEWIAIAPVVITGELIGEVGRMTEIRVVRVLRGELLAGTVIQIDLKRTNRSRSRSLDPKATKLQAEVEYIFLLEPSTVPTAIHSYSLVRGVRGVRALPPEGAGAILASVERFIEVQSTKSDRLLWERFEEMLGETNPLMLETALAQFQKFRRGDPELLASLRPLLAHPRADIREDAARLTGQILDRYKQEPIPEEAALRSDLVARARRDPVVPVRVAATEALDSFPGDAVESILDEIADEDPDQAVRYAAEKLILERRDRASRN